MASTHPLNNAEVVSYREEFRQDFERLNREWIEEFFALEEADLEVFAAPLEKIIEPGGQIFFVLENQEVKGTCALLQGETPHTFELAKMAVAANARGKGYGDLLMRAAIGFALKAGAREIILSSNKKLAPALRLYEKHGFRQVEHISDDRYRRVDIMMRLALQESEAERADERASDSASV